MSQSLVSLLDIWKFSKFSVFFFFFSSPHTHTLRCGPWGYIISSHRLIYKFSEAISNTPELYKSSLLLFQNQPLTLYRKLKAGNRRRKKKTQNRIRTKTPYKTGTRNEHTASAITRNRGINYSKNANLYSTLDCALKIFIVRVLASHIQPKPNPIQSKASQAKPNQVMAIFSVFSTSFNVGL